MGTTIKTRTMCASPLLQRLACALLVLYMDIPVTEANDRISWPTVAVAWAFSLLTTFIVLAVVLLIIKYAKHLRRKRRRDQPPKFNRELSVQSEASDLTRISVPSNQNLYNNSGYRRVPSRESTTNRRKTDFISSWCSKHSLSEVIAANLRENGFNSKEQIESLQPGDVVTLGLPNLATQVQLRGVLEKLLKAKELSATEAPADLHSDLSTQGVQPPHNIALYSVSPHTHTQNTVPTKISQTLPANTRPPSSSSDRSRPRSSTTEDCSLLLTTPSPQQTSPLSMSYNTSTSRHSLAHLSEEPLPCTSTLSILPGRTKQSRLSFHGLLSDAGLYELAESLGTEWRHLATVLGISKPQQEHLVNNYPNNTKQQIYEMLRYWRENERGEKEQVKAVLSKAFSKIRRKDLADRILREQVHGSDEHLQGTQRMNSVV